MKKILAIILVLAGMCFTSSSKHGNFIFAIIALAIEYWPITLIICIVVSVINGIIEEKDGTGSRTYESPEPEERKELDCAGRMYMRDWEYGSGSERERRDRLRESCYAEDVIEELKRRGEYYKAHMLEHDLWEDFKDEHR